MSTKIVPLERISTFDQKSFSKKLFEKARLYYAKVESHETYEAKKAEEDSVYWVVSAAPK
jgi:hypothetical protein